jgi:hypothetical protein
LKTVVFEKPGQFYRALNRLPKMAQKELRDASKVIASKVASEASSRATAQGGVARLVAPYIKAYRDRIPTIRMGSSTKIPRGKRNAPRGLKVNVDAGALNLKNQTISNVMWGAEFGADRYTQFLPWRGNKEGAGYFLWPAIRDLGPVIRREYSDALLDALNKVK